MCNDIVSPRRFQHASIGTVARVCPALTRAAAELEGTEFQPRTLYSYTALLVLFPRCIYILPPAVYRGSSAFALPTALSRPASVCCNSVSVIDGSDHHSLQPNKRVYRIRMHSPVLTYGIDGCSALNRMPRVVMATGAKQSPTSQPIHRSRKFFNKSETRKCSQSGRRCPKFSELLAKIF